MSDYSDGNIEFLILKVKSLDSIVICVYRSQASDVDSSKWSKAIDLINESIKLTQANGSYNNIIMLGDYNIPNADWDSLNAGIVPESSSLQATQLRKLSDLMSNNFMNQTVIDPTRKRNILDLVITNNPMLITHHDIVVNQLLSDHNFIISHLNMRVEKVKYNKSDKSLYHTDIPLYNLKDGDDSMWQSYHQELNKISWDESKCECRSVSDKLEVFYKDIEYAISCVFQRKKEKSSGNKIPLHFRKMMKKKKNISKRMLKTRDEKCLRKLRSELDQIERGLYESLE